MKESKQKVVPYFRNQALPKHPGQLPKYIYICIFSPQSVQSHTEDLAFWSSFLDLYPIARGWCLEPAETEVSTGPQLLDVTHLGVICKTRVDSLRWICPLQWASPPSSTAYIPSLSRNLMHRLCNRHCARSSESSGLRNVSSRQNCSIYVHIN